MVWLDLGYLSPVMEWGLNAARIWPTVPNMTDASGSFSCRVGWGLQANRSQVYGTIPQEQDKDGITLKDQW